MHSMEDRASLQEAEAASSPPTAQRHARGAKTDLVESLLVTILLVLFGTTFVVQAFKIPSESMEPTLLVGDHLLVNKFIFEGTGAWYEKLLPYRSIRRGDIVVFKFPYEDHVDYVKRVIGLPGEHIRINGRKVYVDGTLLSEPYAIYNPSLYDPLRDFPPRDDRVIAEQLRPEWAREIMNYIENGELVVPANHYFVMGDNRDSSSDSRYWGFVDRRAIIGSPMLIYWSVQANPGDYNDRSLAATARGIGQVLTHISTKTRWHRMLRLVN
jgi:signal peptidase I